MKSIFPIKLAFCRPFLNSQQTFSPRVLFKTSSFPDPNKWSNNFNSLSPELIQFLATKNVCLVGIDTPSIDPSDAKELSSHHCIYQNNMAILEGIILDSIQPGEYTLAAFPLKIENADASPVRAILMPSPPLPRDGGKDQNKEKKEKKDMNS